MKVYLLLSFCIILSSCNHSPKIDNEINTNFEDVDPGILTDSETRDIWAGAQLICGKKDYIYYKLGITPHPHSISQENNNHFLKVSIPPRHFGPITGAQWKIPFSPKEECYFSYRVKFSEGFDFVKGGKLPGMAGGTANSGGHIPNGADGWSARMMFWEGGKLSFYLYYLNQSAQWGERLYLKDLNQDTIRIIPGKWHLITQHVKMNEPGKADGILQCWMDGKEAFYADTILYRKDVKLKIDEIFYSIFMGGDDMSWTSEKDQYICLDDFKVANSMIPD